MSSCTVVGRTLFCYFKAAACSGYYYTSVWRLNLYGDRWHRDLTRGSISCWTYTPPRCFPRLWVSCPKASLAATPRHPPNARSSKWV